ncbi:hypothetical protein DFH07DRAFT_763604 [Mycena maculata]|uniref:Uncharacterized protein n=1 Tax=Mycena maculata TaxID=230809 RepID=A0AAD7KGY8_9AGAR|nr:hypothetical protein DFH07DRAFT_763604 [Mycena maculata]
MSYLGLLPCPFKSERAIDTSVNTSTDRDRYRAVLTICNTVVRGGQAQTSGEEDIPTDRNRDSHHASIAEDRDASKKKGRGRQSFSCVKAMQKPPKNSPQGRNNGTKIVCNSYANITECCVLPGAIVGRGSFAFLNLRVNVCGEAYLDLVLVVSESQGGRMKRRGMGALLSRGLKRRQQSVRESGRRCRVQPNKPHSRWHQEARIRGWHANGGNKSVELSDTGRGWRTAKINCMETG